MRTRHSTNPVGSLARPAAAARAIPALALALCAAAAGDVINASFPSPSLDRWMYPFNSTPGTRISISTFGSTPGATDFDSRDGQMLVRFDTASQLPSGKGAALTVTRARLTVEVSNDLVFAYDPTQDPWQCFVSTTDPAWQADADAGQPVECYGVGFRNGWSLQTFQETSPYTTGGSNFLLPGIRNAYAAAFDANGTLADVSQSPRERFDPKPFAIGSCPDLEPGALVPAGTQMRFDLDVSDPAIQGYLRDGISQGRVMLALSSLTFVQQQAGQFPLFVAKESPFVQLGLASAARLELDVSDQPACATADLDCDGSVGGADLGLLLGEWGTDGGSVGADLNGDGTVTGSDLGILLGAWG